MLQLSFVNFKMNSYLLVEGTDTNDRFFIIQTGKVTCYHETKIPETSIKILGPGDFVGVTACMSGHSQMETVIAQTDVTAIAVRRDQYPELIMKNTPIAMKIVRYFAREMRVLNDLRTKITLRKNIVDSPEELAAIYQAQRDSGCKGGMLVTNPIPEQYSMDKAVIDRAIETALKEAAEKGVHGKQTTPFLLAKVKDLTGGDSLASNIQLVYNNARLAAKTAAALCRL